MQGYQAQTGADFDGAALQFKRFILERTDMFDTEPMADLYRVNALGEMLDRYDALTGKGLSHENAVARVTDEFGDIAYRMREEGFDTAYAGHSAAGVRREVMSEDDAARYIEQSSTRAHKKSLGVALALASPGALFAVAGFFSELVGMGYYDGAMGLAVAAMMGMLGIGVYAFFSAEKPDGDARVKGGQFSLGSKLRKKVEQLLALKKKKARKRRAKGIALWLACVVPLLVFISIDWVGFGLAGLFAMVGAGAYELLMSMLEGRAEKKLLDGDQENR